MDVPATAPFYDKTSTLGPQRSFINGSYVSSSSGQTFQTRHPGTGHVICDVETADDRLVDVAVASARAAFAAWSAMPVAERGAILRRAAALLRDRNQELAELETLDTGKAIQETSVVDIISGVEVLEYYAGVTQSLGGSHVDLPPEAFAIMRREPLGVCAAIGAWNYPIQIALWKSAPALACGNTMVFKPSEMTPLTALKLAEIYTEAGMPDGVFNVVLGSGETGSALVQHPDVAKISLTGSVATGKRVAALAAESLKKVTLELGGKSPIVVFDDSDIESAINAALAGNFYSTGQVCSNGTRVFVHDTIFDRFVEEVVERTTRIRVGDPFDPEVQMGPLVSKQQLEKVGSYLEQASASDDVDIRCGGEVLATDDLNGGYFVSPAVVVAASDDHAVVTEEVFGPLMTILKFTDETEVIDRANATRLGLAAAVFSQDFSRAHRVANKLQAGIVWINEYNITPAEIPFGGYKESGIGRENGLQTIEHFTQTKTIYANLGKVEPTY
jgi:betaine-aldehyde dehydrogenase